MFLLITQNQFYRKAPHLVMLGHICSDSTHLLSVYSECLFLSILSSSTSHYSELSFKANTFKAQVQTGAE